MEAFNVEPGVDVILALELAGIVEYTLQLAHKDALGDWIAEEAIQQAGDSTDPSQSPRYVLGSFAQGIQRLVLVRAALRTPGRTGSVGLKMRLLQQKTGGMEQVVGSPKAFEAKITDGNEVKPPIIRFLLNAVPGTLP